MTAYYNEFDPKAAAWLRELIRGGHIAPGDVDERSILDVTPDDLRPYTQRHFFAGIGVWSYALRCAGWPDDRPVWTGSCPCQPFSAAGKRGGIADERHLWPAWQWLIGECRPDVIFGEQVASKDGLGWLDLVHADLEGTGYAVGALDSCAAGVGGPHIRQRLYFAAQRMADAEHAERRPECGLDGDAHGRHGLGRCGDTGGLGDACGEPSKRRTGSLSRTETSVGRTRFVDGRDANRPEHAGASTGGLADDDDAGLEGRRQPGRERRTERAAGPDGVAGGLVDPCHRAGQRSESRSIERRLPAATGTRSAEHVNPSPTNGFWRDSDWLFCRDERWRPVEPGTFPLAHGSPARVGRLRGYGNAIVAPQAAAFVEAFLDEELDRSLRVTFG